MNANVSTFCSDWKNFFPSSVFMSMFSIWAPTNSCRIMDAITIGPIPNDTIEPKFVPNSIARYSNRLNAFALIPYNGMFDKIKNDTKIMSVHFNAVLNPTFFSVGLLTSGRLCSKSRNPIINCSKYCL